MRRLIIVVIALALGWSAYWFYGAASEKAVVAAWFQTRAAASYGELNTRGFPNRFDTTIARPAIATGPIAWSAAWMQTLRLSYAPDHYILAFDARQTLTLQDQTIAISNGAARASAVFEGAGLDRFTLTAETPELTSDQGWTVSANRLLFATRRANGGQEIGLDALTLRHGEASTDLHVEGILKMNNGLATGELSLTASDPVALSEIARAIGLPVATLPLSVELENGQMLWNDQPLGPVMRLP